MAPAEYDNILYRDLMYKLEGFKNRIDMQELLLRQVAYSAYISDNVPAKHPTKKDIQKFWPVDEALTKDAEAGRAKISKASRALLKEAVRKLQESKQQKDA